MFWLQTRKLETGNTATKTRKSKEEVKEELCNLLIEGEKLETKDLDEKVDKVEKCKDVVIREWCG